MVKNTAVDILLVEDNPTDAELTLRALKKHNLTNNVEWVKDGAAALDFLFRHGDYAERENSLMSKYNKNLSGVFPHAETRRESNLFSFFSATSSPPRANLFGSGSSGLG